MQVKLEFATGLTDTFMANDKEPKFWLLLLKLVMGAAALISVVWLALWYAESYMSSHSIAPPSAAKPDWGIVGDSPIPNNR
jgi:hypothetical protein